MFKQITPFVLTSDLDTSIRFYCGILGFDCTFKADGYAFLRRDHAAIRVVVTPADVDLSDERRHQMIYIDVDDVDALYEQLKPGLDTLPQDRIRTPFDQHYGQREFHVADDYATLILFGQPLSRQG